MRIIPSPGTRTSQPTRSTSRNRAGPERGERAIASEREPTRLDSRAQPRARESRQLIPPAISPRVGLHARLVTIAGMGTELHGGRSVPGDPPEHLVEDRLRESARFVETMEAAREAKPGGARHPLEARREPPHSISGKAFTGRARDSNTRDPVTARKVHDDVTHRRPQVKVLVAIEVSDGEPAGKRLFNLDPELAPYIRRIDLADERARKKGAPRTPQPSRPVDEGRDLSPSAG